MGVAVQRLSQPPGAAAVAPSLEGAGRPAAQPRRRGITLVQLQQDIASELADRAKQSPESKGETQDGVQQA